MLLAAVLFGQLQLWQQQVTHSTCVRAAQHTPRLAPASTVSPPRLIYVKTEHQYGCHPSMRSPPRGTPLSGRLLRVLSLLTDPRQDSEPPICPVSAPYLCPVPPSLCTLRRPLCTPTPSPRIWTIMRALLPYALWFGCGTGGAAGGAGPVGRFGAGRPSCPALSCWRGNGGGQPNSRGTGRGGERSGRSQAEGASGNGAVTKRP